jgi:hypothetical protein
MLRSCASKPHPRLFKGEQVARLSTDEAEKLWNQKRKLLEKDLCSEKWAKEQCFSKANLLRSLGLLYCRTGRKEFADKAIEGFESLGKGGFWSDHIDRRTAWGLSGYVEALDLIFEYFRNSRPELHTKVVNELAKKADQIYHLGLKNIYEAKYYFITLGRVAVVLAEYKSPYKSGPREWLLAATQYLFDKHPVVGRPMDGMFNPGGLYSLGGYKGYFYDNLFSWVRQCRNATGVNIIEAYPFLRKLMLNMCWEIIPYGIPPEYNAMHRLSYSHFSAGVEPMLKSMLAPERYWVMWFIENLPGCLGLIRLKKEIDDWKPKAPPWTAFISEDAESVVFRESWQKKEVSDYIFLRVQHYPFDAYRSMCHHDNLSFECWLHGDALIIDCGEVRGNALGQGAGYGPITAKGHNVVMLCDGDGKVGGAVKGDQRKLKFYNPARIATCSTTPPVQFALCGMKWEWMEKYEDFHFKKPGEDHFWWFFYEPFENFAKKMSHPVLWRRAVLYPQKDYFIIVDEITPLSEAVERKIKTLFHLASWRVDKGKRPPEVKGELEVEGQEFDWQGKPFREEVEIKEGNMVRWFTKNVNNEDVELTLYSVPKSLISCERYWCNVGGVEGAEHPLIRFKIKAPDMHRITVISPRFPHEPKREFAQIKARGAEAIAVKTRNISDYIFAGAPGIKRIAKLSTDARMGLVRLEDGEIRSLLLIEASRLRFRGKRVVESDTVLKHLSLRLGAETFEGHFECESPAKVKLSVRSPVKSAYMIPDVDEWTRMLKGSPKERQKLRCRRGKGFVEISFPKGAGAFAVTFRDTSPPKVVRLHPRGRCPAGLKAVRVYLKTGEPAWCWLIQNGVKKEFEKGQGETEHYLTISVREGRSYKFLYSLKDKAGNAVKVRHSFTVTKNVFWDDFRAPWALSEMRNVLVADGVRLKRIYPLRIKPMKDATISPIKSWQSGHGWLEIGSHDRCRIVMEFKVPESLDWQGKASLVLITFKTGTPEQSMLYRVYLLEEDFDEDDLRWGLKGSQEPIGEFKAEGDLKGKEVRIPLSLNISPGKSIRLMLAPASKNYRSERFYARESLFPPYLEVAPEPGVIVSDWIEIPQGCRWQAFRYEATVPRGALVRISLLGEGGQTIIEELKDNHDLSGVTERKVKLQAVLEASPDGRSPVLRRWKLVWR